MNGSLFGSCVNLREKKRFVTKTLIRDAMNLKYDRDCALKYRFFH